MKTSLFTLLIGCMFFTVSYAQSSIENQSSEAQMQVLDSNPWEISKLSVDQIVEMSDIQFEADESELTRMSRLGMKDLIGFLLANESVSIEVRGHTNNIPAAEYCNELSTNRANAVRDYLIQEGVDADKLVATGYGKSLPRASSLTAAERKSNQRVDIKIISL